jgi:tetratricopeptide (TPR) repeat protein
VIGIKKIILIFVCSITLFPLCFASSFDWKKLHEEADTIPSSQEALIQPQGETPEKFYMLGLVYLNEYKHKEAFDVFTRAVNLDNKTLELKWGMAEVLRRQHKEAQSRTLLEEIIKAVPDFAPAFISLAYIEYLESDFNKSVALARHVIELGQAQVDESNYVRAYLLVAGGKGMIAHYGGPISKVINGTAVLPNLKKAEALQPDAAGVLFGLGSFYLLAPSLVGGDRAKALACLEKAVAADPYFADAYVRLAQAYKIKGDSGKYEMYMKKALEIDPENALALDAQRKKCKFICVSMDK